VSAEYEGMNGGSRNFISHDAFDEREHRLEVSLSEEQRAAVEGWRAANRIGSCEEAVKELVRIGLLSEIALIYRMVAGTRNDPDGQSEDGLNATR